jgi:hypothetical protein
MILTWSEPVPGREMHLLKSSAFQGACYVNYHGEVTTNREALIEKLVVSLRLGVPERRLLDLDCVSIGKVAAAVKRLFSQHGVFPPHARLWKPGELAFEGYFLVKRPDGRVELAWQRGNAHKPTELADRSSTVYEDINGSRIKVHRG